MIEENTKENAQSSSVNLPFGIGCETLDRELWDRKEIYPWMDECGKMGKASDCWARVEKNKECFDCNGWMKVLTDSWKRFYSVLLMSVNGNKPLHGRRTWDIHPLISEEAFEAWKKICLSIDQTL